MKKLLVLVAAMAGMFAAPKVQAQSVLPRAGWVANASSSQGADTPSHVLDGSASTRWTSGGDQTPGQWFTVDFGSAKTFTQVTVDVAGNTGDYARSYEIYVSNDGQTWGTPVASGTGATGIMTIVFPAQTGRFIGIVQTGTSSTNWWSIAELNVYTGTVPTAPLAPSGWTASAPVSGSSDQPSKAIDGNLATRFSTDVNQVNGQSFQLDMGSAQLLAGLKMDSGSNTNDYARGYQVFASNSTSNWGSAVATGTGTSSAITVYFPQTTARYVKIVQTGTASNWWSLAELTMYTVGSFAPTASVLPRLGWSASASSSASGNGPANALDDSGGTRWSTSVNQANGQTFIVDMQATRSFTQVTLDSGSANASDYPRGYQLFVSGDGSTWGSAVATGSGAGQLTTISFSSQSARYVKIVQTGSSSTNKWSIAELNVYGVPPATLVRQGWTASAVLDSAEAQLGIDGKSETQWSTNTAQVNGQTYQVDMKVAQSFNQITLDVNCNPADYPRGYQVFASNITSTWGAAIASGTGTSAMIAIAFAPQSARYLKVVQTASASNYWGLAELNVLNTNPSACSAACVALDACHDVGTCNPSTGVCSNPAKANGTACNDGNACTQTDSCQAGVCTGASPVTCVAQDQCHVAGACDSSTGVCSNPTKTEGTACNDGSACTTSDACHAGACTGSAVTCTAQDQCHVAGTCDPASGVCTNPAKTNGTACNDGNACTQTDTCQTGTCTGSNSITCTASDQCHAVGTCNTSTGVCSNPAKTNGTACSDGNACTQTDSCQAGVCTGASPVTCVASDQCHTAGTCDTGTGVCSNPAKANGTTCSDGNACTQTDACQGGACTGGNPVTCVASDQCHTSGTCDATTGACSNLAKSDGTGCEDGNACTTGDVCQAGVCAGSGSCGSQVTASMEFANSLQQPSLPFSIVVDHTSVHAGDTVIATMELAYDGVAISTEGRFDIANHGSSDFVVPGYSVSVEYLSTTSHDWVPLATRAFDAAGQLLLSSAPYDLTFSAAVAVAYDFNTDTVHDVVTPGVTYAPGRMAGTRIAPGSTAISEVLSQVVLPQEILPVLTDPAQAMSIREVIRIDGAPGLPSGAEAATPIDPLPVGPLDVQDLEGLISLGSASPVSMTVPDSVPIGSSATFTAPFLIPPLLTPAAASSQQGGYKGYLQRLAQSQLVLHASIAGGAPGFNSGASVSANSPALAMLVPIVDPTMVSGSVSPQPAGYPLSYNLALKNTGTEAATNVVLQDYVDVDSIAINTYNLAQATVVAPTTLAVGETQPASMLWQSPGGQENNIYSLGRVTWTDSVGNVYGQLSSSFWYDHLGPSLPYGLISLAGLPTAPVPIGSPQTFTATALDDHGQPAVGVTVTATVTGANAQAPTAVTNAAGVATFTDQGALPGGDTIVASATITTAPAHSSAGTIFWSAPYGTPCVGTDTPLDIMVIIDSSASMEGPKLDGAKAASQAFLDTLDLTRDQIGVGYFNAFGHLSAQLTSTFSQAKAGIDNVQPGDIFFSPTNIGAGLTTALDELVSTRARPTATPVIVFITDGGNSYGDPEPAIARLKASGIRTLAFGLGSDADAIMLNRLSTSKNDYYYAPAQDELAWVYGSLGQNLCRDQLPIVHAGGDHGAYGVRLPHVLALQGEIHDDGPPGRLTSVWTTVSGPGPVTFADVSAPSTTAVFTEPGTYVLQLAASDGTFTKADTATLTVDSEPSLTGASLVAALGTPSPLTVGTSESLVLTLKDAGAQPIADFPIQVTITGPNAGTSTLTTNASGVATLTYTSQTVGTDVLSAVALGITQLAATPVSVSWTAAASEAVVTQGWIGGPVHQSTVTGQVPITVGAGITLTSGTVTYWPMSAPDQVHTLATGVSGGPGAAVAALDTTVLANGPWIVKLDGTDSVGASQVSEVSVTVTGDYKPGRVVVELTEFTVPLPGIPLTVGRRYDSLERDHVGDFGHGWSLTLGSPRLEVDPAHNVTITMPDGRRVTFYFQATSVTGSVTFAWLYGPGYVPEAGTYGSLTADGCPLMTVAGGQLVCFLEGSLDYAPTTYTYTDQYGRVFTMGASGELKSITDRQQNVLTFTPNGISGSGGVTMAISRDSAGRITQITTPSLDLSNLKLAYTYAYDSAGDLTTVSLPTNNQFALINYTYDADHFLLTTKDAEGHFARTSTYDTSGRLATDTDALGNTTSYAYDLSARKTTITNPDTGTVQQTFDERGLLLTEVDPLGRTTQHTYDANRNELTRTNALNEVSTFTYDPNGNNTSRSNARGEMTSMTYSSFSEPLTLTDPLQHQNLTIAYDDFGIPVKFSDSIGTLATFTSSEHGLPLSVTDAAGNTAYFTYDSFGDLTSRTDRLGRVTRYGYDGIGRKTSMTGPRGGLARFFYDGMGNLGTEIDPLGSRFDWNRDFNENIVNDHKDNNVFAYQRDTQYTFDLANHLTKERYFDGTTRTYTRDFRGNKLTETDESSRTTTYQYDKAGRLTKTTFPDQTYTTRGYDALGRLVTATDERGHAATYEYETGCGCSERVTKLTDALGHATMMTYDPAGRRSSVTDAAGHQTSYTYDVRGHLIRTDYADLTNETDTYDVLGRRAAHTDQASSVTHYEYDAEGQLTSVSNALSLMQYVYDLSGNLASVTDANNHTTSYSYDLLNRKTSRTLPVGTSETFAYDIIGNEVSHVDFRGKTSTYNFDHRDRLLTKVPDSTLGEPSVAFAYNPRGTRASMVDASGTTTYGYDARDRLLTKATPAGTLTYAYDLAGNLASIRSSNPNGTSVDYAWDAANQLVSVIDNRTSGVTTSAYTATGRPATVTQPSGVGAVYGYDPLDRAMSRALLKFES